MKTPSIAEIVAAWDSDAPPPPEWVPPVFRRDSAAMRAERTRRDDILRPSPVPRRQDPLPPYVTLYPIGFPSMKARWLQEIRPTDPRYFRSEHVAPDEWPLGWLAWNHSFHVPKRSRPRGKNLGTGFTWEEVYVRLRDHNCHPDKEFGFIEHPTTWEIIRTR